MTDEIDVDARSEPVLAITILAGIAGVLLAPAWGTIMDDSSVDAVVVVVVTFIAGLFYGAAGYFLLGLAVWLGAKAVGIHPPFRAARQLVGFSAVPLALSLVALVPVITIGFGEDWFRSGGADEGPARCSSSGSASCLPCGASRSSRSDCGRRSGCPGWGSSVRLRSPR